MDALDTSSTHSSNQSNTHRVRGWQLHGWQFSRGSLLSSCLDPSRGQPGAGELHKPWEQDLRSEISWKLRAYWKRADRGGQTGVTLVGFKHGGLTKNTNNKAVSLVVYKGEASAWRKIGVDWGYHGGILRDRQLLQLKLDLWCQE